MKFASKSTYHISQKTKINFLHPQLVLTPLLVRSVRIHLWRIIAFAESHQTKQKKNRIVLLENEKEGKREEVKCYFIEN